MSATNSTPNYGLPQYVADDKPTYLGDFNKAMLDIDTNMKSIDNKAEGAESGIASVQATANQALENANQASTKADTAQATATQAQTTATTAKNTADTAQSTATEAKNTATIALNKANQNEVNISKFNLTNIKNYTGSQIQLNHGSVVSGTVTVATNSDGTVCKIYGNLILTGDGVNQLRNVTVANTDLRPNTNITINPIGIFSTSNTLAESVSVTIDTEGNLTFVIYGNASGNGNVILTPVLLFMSDFGDVSIS